MGLNFKDIEKLELNNKLSNHYFESIFDTSDEWIRSRSGIESRYFSESSTSKMALSCVKKLNYDKELVDMILVASFTQDLILPSIAAKIHEELNIKSDCFSADINIACTGFVGALILAEKYLEKGRQAIIVASEKISDVLDMTDRRTSILFGDGCACVVVEKNNKQWISDIKTFGRSEPLSMNKGGFLKMQGKDVYRFAISEVPKSIINLVDLGGYKVEDINYVFSHQANERIIDKISKKTKILRNKFPCNISKYGNTSAASIPLLLEEEYEKLKDGQKIILTAFGAGLTISSILMEW